MNTALTLAAALTGLVMVTGTATAQPEGTPPSALSPSGADLHWPDFATPDHWTLQVQPRAWYVSPSGKIRLPSTGAPGGRIRVEDLNLDNPLVQPYGELSIKFGGGPGECGPWRIALSGFNNSLDRSGGSAAGFQLGDVVVAPGGTFNTSFDFTSLQAQVGYRFWTYDFGAEGGEAPDRTVLRLEGVLGGRYYDLDIAFSSSGSLSQAQRTFGEAFLGAHAELQVARDFSIDLDVSGGGWSDSSNSVLSIDAVIAFSWRPIDGVGLQIGWRQLAFDLSNGEGAGEFEYQGRVAGVFVGLTLRF